MNLSVEHNLSQKEKFFDTLPLATLFQPKIWLVKVMLYVVLRIGRKKLKKLHSEIQEIQFDSIDDLNLYHQVYIELKGLHKTIGIALDTKGENLTFWERRLVSELKKIRSISYDSKELLGSKLFPTPKDKDARKIEEASEKLKDFFEDWDDDETDNAYLKHHPNLN